VGLFDALPMRVHRRTGRLRRYLVMASVSIAALTGILPVQLARADDVAFVSGAIVDTRSMTSQVEVPCPAGLQGVCYELRELTAVPDPCPGCIDTGGAHTDANTTSYYTITLEFKHEYCSNSQGCSDLYQVGLVSRVWYNGGSAGNVDRSVSCYDGGREYFACESETDGSYWDSNRSANSDWENHTMMDEKSNQGFGVYLRIYTSPKGAVSFDAFTGS